MRQTLVFVFILFASSFLPLYAQVLRGHCSAEYFQGCKSCKQIRQIVEKGAPNDGEYYRGAQWNGLYTAYVHNCLDLAKLILDRGGNPNWGGSQGSMLLSVADRWPHNNVALNKKWADLLIQYGASAKKKIPEMNKTSVQLAKDWGFNPDYPEIWKKFLR
ncbi:MAG: hypothetical protein AB7F43_09240 [Bacteriovoracia bacterium]